MFSNVMMMIAYIVFAYEQIYAFHSFLSKGICLSADIKSLRKLINHISMES